jgi:hypothetical protein
MKELKDLPDNAKPKNPAKAAEACRILIAAYCNDPQDVDWSDVQGALECSLKAFGLPADYPERIHERDRAEADGESA